MAQAKYSFSNLSNQADNRLVSSGAALGKARIKTPSASWLQSGAPNMNPYLAQGKLQGMKLAPSNEAYMRSLVRENQRRALHHPKGHQHYGSAMPRKFMVSKSRGSYKIYTGRDSSIQAQMASINSVFSHDNAQDLRTLVLQHEIDPKEYYNPYFQTQAQNMKNMGYQSMAPFLQANPALAPQMMHTANLWDEIGWQWSGVANVLWDRVNEEVREALMKGAKIVVEDAFRESGGRFRAVLGTYHPDTHTLRVGIGKDQWYARFFEEGAAPHDIKPRRRARRRKALRIRALGKRRFFGRVRHPGIRANPFFRRAVETNEYKIITAVGTSLYFQIRMADFPPRGRPYSRWR